MEFPLCYYLANGIKASAKLCENIILEVIRTLNIVLSVLLMLNSGLQRLHRVGYPLLKWVDFNILGRVCGRIFMYVFDFHAHVTIATVLQC